MVHPELAIWRIIGRCSCSVDRRTGHLRLEPAKNSGQAANPEHSQDLSQPASLDQVAGDLKNFIDRCSIQSLQEQRDKPSDRGCLDRGIGVKSRPGRHRTRRTSRPATGIPRHDGKRLYERPTDRAKEASSWRSRASRSIRSWRSHPLRSATIVSSAVGMSPSIECRILART